MRVQSFAFFFLSLLFFFSLPRSRGQNILRRGSSLSVERNSDVLVSPDGTFSCGFYSRGENAYWFSIWFTHSLNRTVVWMANRDRPVNGRASKVSLQRNGAMVLTDIDGSVIWETRATSNNIGLNGSFVLDANTTYTNLVADRAELLDSGNLVVKDPHGRILWQSFDFPTDTLLPNQPFTQSKKLVSNLAGAAYYSGYFSFLFDNDNVLRLIYDGPEISSLYWPNPIFNVYTNGRTNYNSSRIARLDEMGRFYSSDRLQFNASDMGYGVKRRLTLDDDGNLRLYSLHGQTGLWSITWVALAGGCDVHGICGRNGICIYSPKPKYSCPPGYEVADTSNWAKGCKAKFKVTLSNNSQPMKFVELQNTDYYGFDLSFSQAISFDSCRSLCLNDSHCEAFNYRPDGRGLCFAKSALFNGFSSPDFSGNLYLKVPASIEAAESFNLQTSDLKCSSEASIMIGTLPMTGTTGRRVRWVYLYFFVSIFGLIEFLIIVSGWWFLFKKHGLPASIESGYRAISSQFRKFDYAELKRATRKFKEELGQGATGAVYKGVLEDGRVVAVKRLRDVYQGEEVFWAEVSTIGRIYHINLVRMWGFCSEGAHRLLVYESVEKQSLDKNLFAPNFLGWKERFKIALGTAKGLAYLHHECLEWVIHCDIKPENILLDSDFEPKVADFGLAKLSKRGSPIAEFSHVRGTKGYMAPEWALNLPITAKVDVYSYGVVVLEMVKGIRLSNKVMKDESVEQEAELTRISQLVKQKIQCGEDLCTGEIVDPRLEGQFSPNQVAALVKIGISCIEEDRNMRPTMDHVVQVLLDCKD